MRVAHLVGAARSGTTLLSEILDAHPTIGCPPEGGLPGLLDHTRRSWMAVTGANARTMPERALIQIRAAIEAPMQFYLEREEKSLYCDKSLDSVYFLDQMQEVFPDSRYVLLFRHPMDVVASGIDASPWGFTHYGYQGFLQGSPGNFVAPLVQYWMSHTEAAVSWRRAHEDRCLTVRYEDLVTEPGRVVAAIFSFLGVETDEQAVDRAFTRQRVSNGPGDHKFAHTRSVETTSIGRGKRVPVELIPPSLLGAMNEALAELGYGPVDASWNFAPQTRPEARAPSSEVLIEIMTPGAVADGASLAAIRDPFAVVADDDTTLRWVVDPDVRSIVAGDGDVAYVIAGSCEDLVRFVRGEDNAGMLLRHGRIRHAVRADSEVGRLDIERDLLDAAAAIRALSATLT